MGGAFKKGVLNLGVIQKCAAYAARESGDVRRAIDLLRVAGELAERNNSKNISAIHIDEAKNKIERDKILDIVGSHPKQFQVVLNSIILLSEEKNKESFFTGDVYNYYQDVCLQTKTDSLTQRRISDILAEICKKLEANTYISGEGARAYLDLSRFKQSKIEVIFQNFQHPIYTQAYDNFEPFMSVVDLLFNCGDESLKVLRGESNKNI